MSQTMEVDCPECDGSGRENGGEKCRECDGDGTITVAKPQPPPAPAKRVVGRDGEDGSSG